MSKFNVGDLVTTTATECCDEPEDKVPLGEVFTVRELSEADNQALIHFLDYGLEVNSWWVDMGSLTLADDPDEGGQQQQEKQEGKQEGTHAELKRVFSLAVAQSQSGKGADRHGNGESFTSQPIFTINQALGSNHGALFQVAKKATESARLAATDRKDMAKNELLGAMVYAAAAYLLLED